MFTELEHPHLCVVLTTLIHILQCTWIISLPTFASLGLWRFEAQKLHLLLQWSTFVFTLPVHWGLITNTKSSSEFCRCNVRLSDYQKPLLVLALCECVLMCQNNESTIICTYIDHTFTIYSTSCVAIFALAYEASIGVGTVCTRIAVVCTSHTLINIYTRRVEIDRIY